MTTFGKLLVLAGVLVVALIVGAYFLFANKAEAPTVSETATTSAEAMADDSFDASDITWKVVDTETNAEGTPHQEISVVVKGTTHVIGTFPGNCQEVKAGGGIDGKGLLAGELSALQCYWAGSGDEIGVFAHEDGGYQIMVGELGEPTAETPAFRGNFKIKVDIPE